MAASLRTQQSGQFNRMGLILNPCCCVMKYPTERISPPHSPTKPICSKIADDIHIHPSLDCIKQHPIHNGRFTLERERESIVTPGKQAVLSWAWVYNIPPCGLTTDNTQASAGLTSPGQPHFSLTYTGMPKAQFISVHCDASC